MKTAFSCAFLAFLTLPACVSSLIPEAIEADNAAVAVGRHLRAVLRAR